jgi:aspergillopepsin I
LTLDLQTCKFSLDNGQHPDFVYQYFNSWVTSTHLPTSQRGDRPASRIYDPKANGAIELTGHTWKELYGDRSFVSGKIYLDKVTIGNLTVPNQAVGATQSISAMYIQDNSRDGMLGLGFISKSRVKPKAQLTWFEMIRPKLAAPVFTAHLKRRRAGK